MTILAGVSTIVYGICGTCECLKKVGYSDHEVQCLRDLFILYLFGLNRIKANSTGTIFFNSIRK